MATVDHKSLHDQIACVEREIKMRRKVYPHQIFKGRMTRTEAEHELRTMEAVLETLKALVPKLL